MELPIDQQLGSGRPQGPGDGRANGGASAGQPAVWREGTTVAARGRRRTGGDLIKSESADDRRKAFRRASRNTFVVRTLRRAMPIAILAVVAGYVASAFQKFEFSVGGATLPIPQITTEDLTMKNPRYAGFTKDGGRYEVRAQSAKQDFSNPRLIELQGISGELTDAKGGITTLKAAAGRFDTRANTFVMEEAIRIETTDGLSADLSEAVVETKKGLITSSRPVRVRMNDNQIDAARLAIDQKAKTAVFQGDVITLLHPPTTPPQPRPARQGTKKPPPKGLGQMMSPQNGPVRVTAQQLEVDNADGSATFTGNVVTQQGDAVLESGVLVVDYGPEQNPKDSGAADASATGPAPTAAAFGTTGTVRTITIPGALRIRRGDSQTVTAASGVFEVKRQIARLAGPVRLSNGPGQTASGDNAVFDGAENIAYLTDNVVLSGGKDQQARAKRAEFRIAEDVAILTGNVEVSQGANRLTGGRLMINRARRSSVLTSPAGSTVTPGRISARFMPPGQSSAQTKKPAASGWSTTRKAAQAAGFGAFQTDTGAPIEIEATRLDVSDVTKNAVFKGNVVAKQGGFSLKAATLKAHYTGAAALGDPGAGLGAVKRSGKGPVKGPGTGPGKGPGKPSRRSAKSAKEPTEIKTIRADGKVLVASAGGQTASGDWATIDMAKKLVTLGGDVVLKQGKTTVRGTKLTIDMTTGLARITHGSRTSQGWATSAQPAGGDTAQGQQPGVIRRGGRPSLTLYPSDFQKQKPTQPR